MKTPMTLDHKATAFILAALKLQLVVWESKAQEDMSEDDFADLQNDIMYMQILIGSLEESL